ncbi:hypothetical protein ACIBQX_40680 [Nonomuraea sp. NPDC049714]
MILAAVRAILKAILDIASRHTKLDPSARWLRGFSEIPSAKNRFSAGWR